MIDFWLNDRMCMCVCVCARLSFFFFFFETIYQRNLDLKGNKNRIKVFIVQKYISRRVVKTAIPIRRFVINEYALIQRGNEVKSKAKQKKKQTTPIRIWPTFRHIDVHTWFSLCMPYTHRTTAIHIYILWVRVCVLIASLAEFKYLVFKTITSFSLLHSLSHDLSLSLFSLFISLLPSVRMNRHVNAM